MIIFPSIDIKDGVCVRLYKGDYGTAHRVADDPIAKAAAFKAAGADHLHLVDLDGARDGVRKNRELLMEIAKAFGGFTELGGGIRDLNALEDCLSAGINRAVIGSAAVQNPTFLKTAASEYGKRLSVGIDAKDGSVKTSGWTKDTGISYLEFAAFCDALGIDNIIFTDISRDGMQTGPNLEQLAALIAQVHCQVTASGGVRELCDIRALKSAGAYGAICGKSLYAGTLDLRAAIAAGKE